MVQRVSADLGAIITATAVRDLPLNGRTFTQLLMLTPGATPVTRHKASSVTFQDAGPSGIPGTAIINFDARNSFADAKAPAPFRQSQFGAAVGAPVLKNRTFFYGGYEGWRYRQPTQVVQSGSCAR